MLESLMSPKAFDYKLAVDGRDLLEKPIGEQYLNEIATTYILKHTMVDKLPDANGFIDAAIKTRQKEQPSIRGLSAKLCDKYEIGLFTVSDKNTFDTDYVLFNREQLEFWKDAGTNLYGLTFIVVPSRNWDNQINEVGLRITDTKDVHDAFKWIFPYGQRATFGLERCTRDKKLILCEGAFDMIALRESGYENSVGLGSAWVTAKHKVELQTDNWVMTNDSDMLQYADLSKACLYIPEGKDPFDVWLAHGKVDILFIDND